MTLVFTSSVGYFLGLFVLSSGVDEHISFEKDGAQNQGLVQVHIGKTETTGPQAFQARESHLSRITCSGR